MKNILFIILMLPLTLFAQYTGGVADGSDFKSSNTDAWDVVALNAGTISGSQTIYEDEDPAPFISDAAATGQGTISYQWQKSYDQTNWSDIANETGETYDAPVLTDLAPFTMYARRVAFDDNSSQPSNVVSIEVLEAPIPYYYIEAKHSQKVFDVENAGGRGTNVQQYTALGTDNQAWSINDAGDGYFWIEPKHALGQCIDMGAWSTENGGNAILWTYFGNDNQKWFVEATTDGYYKFINKHSNKSLDVEGILTTNGATILQWDYVGGANQQFKTVAFGSQKASSKNDPLFPYIRESKIASDVTVYPNPFTEFVNINVKNSSSNEIKIKLFDISGKLIETKLFNNPQITYEMQNLHKGMYFMQIIDDNTIISTEKLIKN